MTITLYGGNFAIWCTGEVLVPVNALTSVIMPNTCWYRAGGTMTAVMSAANEKAVEVFLREEIEYLDIVPLVSACCEAHKADLTASPTIEDIVSFDQWARDWTQEHAKSFKRTMAAV